MGFLIHQTRMQYSPNFLISVLSLSERRRECVRTHQKCVSITLCRMKGKRNNLHLLDQADRRAKIALSMKRALVTTKNTAFKKWGLEHL